MQQQGNIESIAFYVAVFIVASLATLARSVSSSSDRDWRSIVGKSCTSGFIAFGTISFIVGGDDSHARTHWYFLGIAALIGLLAREQDKIARLVISKALRIGKILSDDEENKDASK